MHYSLSDTILDLVQNSQEAGADHIELTLEQSDSSLDMVLKDNGRGMTEEEMQKALDPFYTDGIKHKHRKVGLGLPFLVQLVEMTDGSFELDSRKGEGTELKVRFNLNHIDTPPLGDLSYLFLQALCLEGSHQMCINREFTQNGKEDGYRLDRRELQEVLGDFSDAQTMILLREYIRSQE